MAETSDNQTAEQVHCDAFRRENADLDIRRPAHDLNATPLLGLATGRTVGLPTATLSRTAIVRRSLVHMTTRRTSFDVWAALASLEDFLSDYRRIAPRFHFMQTAGEANIAVGNEYRLTLSDPALLSEIDAALGTLDPDRSDRLGIDRRVMDVRVVRAGPWGGETGELVVEALQNHALAGASSLWILAHDDSDDGNMRLTLDAVEVARWAWAPDFVASQQGQANLPGRRIIDWDYLFERLAQSLDGVPEVTEPGASFSMSDVPITISRSVQVAEALKIHSGLMPYFNRMTAI